jgi:hypothetical protein
MIAKSFGQRLAPDDCWGTSRADKKTALVSLCAACDRARRQHGDRGAGQRGRLELSAGAGSHLYGRVRPSLLVRKRDHREEPLRRHRRHSGLALDLRRPLDLRRRALRPFRLRSRLVREGLCGRRRLPKRDPQGRRPAAGHRSLFGDAQRSAEQLAVLRQRRRRLQCLARRRFPRRPVRRLPLHE